MLKPLIQIALELLNYLLLIKDHNMEFEKYLCKLSTFSDLEYSSSIFNILLINFNFILEQFNYLEKH